MESKIQFTKDRRKIDTFETFMIYPFEGKVKWDLLPSINILEGENGSGKSTLLNNLKIELYKSQILDFFFISELEDIVLWSDSEKKEKAFIDAVNSLIKNKTILRDKDSRHKGMERPFIFKTNEGKTIYPPHLSNGERNFVSLLSKIKSAPDNSIIIIDDIEGSCHVSVQEQLIEKMLEINPTCQYIITTHSGSIFVPKYLDCFDRINELIVK